MKNIKRFSLIFLWLLAGCAVQAQTDTIYIEEILIAGKKAPGVLTTGISAESVKLTTPRDAGDIFKSQTGFGIVKRGNYAMEPVLRGFKYEQLNIQIDGGTKATCACPNRMDPAISQISPDEIEKIEIIKGPYSVRYGSSFGGVLNIISKKPAITDGKKYAASLEGGYESNGGNLYSSLHLLTVQNKTDAVVNVSWKDFGNYESGNGTEIASSFNRNGYSMKFGFNPNAKNRLQLSLRQGFAKDVLHAGLPMDADEDNSTMISLDYMGRSLSPRILSTKFKLYYSFADHVMSNSRRPNASVVDAVSTTESSVIGGRFELAIKGGSNDLLYVGFDGNITAKDGFRDRTVYKNPCADPPMLFDPPKVFEDKVFQDSRINNLGVFAENRLEVNQNLLWVTGFRIDYVTSEIKNPENDFLEFYDTNINPDNEMNISASSAFHWELNNNAELQWAIGRGARSAEITERYINHFTVGMDAHEYLGNPYLSPEVNYQTDLNFTYDAGKTDFFANVFFAYIQDYISAVVDTTISRKYMPCMNPKYTKRFTNIDEANLYGFEAGFSWMVLESIEWSTGASYTHAQNVTNDEPLPETPPLQIKTSAFYKNNKLLSGLKGRWAAEQNRVATSFSESETASYLVFDMVAAYKLNKMIEIKLSVTNLLDENYADHVSRPYKNMEVPSLYYEPGRSFNFGLKIKL